MILINKCVFSPQPYTWPCHCILHCFWMQPKIPLFVCKWSISILLCNVMCFKLWMKYWKWFIFACDLNQTYQTFVQLLISLDQRLRFFLMPRRVWLYGISDASFANRQEENLIFSVMSPMKLRNYRQQNKPFVSSPPRYFIYHLSATFIDFHQ